MLTMIGLAVVGLFIIVVLVQWIKKIIKMLIGTGTLMVSSTAYLVNHKIAGYDQWYHEFLNHVWGLLQ